MDVIVLIIGPEWEWNRHRGRGFYWKNQYLEIDKMCNLRRQCDNKNKKLIRKGSPPLLADEKEIWEVWSDCDGDKPQMDRDMEFTGWLLFEEEVVWP